MFGVSLESREYLEGEGEVCVYSEPDGDELYVGVSYRKIADDETGAQFKERAKRQVTELLEKNNVPVGELKFGVQEGSWYDG
jgi:hypothetical protein